jgi:hypothetical protein
MKRFGCFRPVCKGYSMLMDDTMAHPPARPKLSDPESCGEDHGYNLSRVTEIARLHCGDCEQYHITTPLNRLAGQSGWNGKARKILIEFVRQFLTERRLAANRIDIVIAGAADTSILASCAHAASTIAGVKPENVHFTVLDKCETPLMLCCDFAQVHGLNVVTSPVDLTTLVKPYSADVIIMHNTLSFIPQIHRAAILRECAKWLKPNGRIALWVSLFRESGSRQAQRSIDVSRRIRTMIEAGALIINEPMAQFIGRLDKLVDMPRANPHDFGSMADLQSLLTETQLSVSSIETFDRHALVVLGQQQAV